MNNVIGPISSTEEERLQDWYTMRVLKEDIKYCNETDPVGYKYAIARETQDYKTFLKNYVQGKIT